MFTAKTYRKTITAAQLAWLFRTRRAEYVAELDLYRSTTRPTTWYVEMPSEAGRGITYQVHD